MLNWVDIAIVLVVGVSGLFGLWRGFVSCADLDRCRYVACKIHQLHAMWGEEKKSNYIKHATREYNIQRTLNHPRLVGLLDVFEIDVNSFCTGSAPASTTHAHGAIPCSAALRVRRLV